jgi:HAD superfamily hydrolase (TIGR01509 family)
MTNAVIFDIGGVLWHPSYAAQHLLEAEWGKPKGSIYRAIFETDVAERAMIGLATRAEMMQEAQRRLSLSDFDLEVVKDVVWRGSEKRFDTELLAFIRSLRPYCKTGIISDVWEGARPTLQDHINEGTFDVIVYSCEEEVRKPNPVIYERALARLKVEAANAFFVDDRPYNVEGAQTVGMHAVQYRDREQVIQAINDWLVNSNSFLDLPPQEEEI